ncbi:MAG: hypothetical protein AAF902_16695 [Chloroflexota bacterium]
MDAENQLRPNPRWWNIVRKIFRAIWLLLLAILFVVVIRPEWPAFGDPEVQIDQQVGLRQFNFPSFWTSAVIKKRGDSLANQHAWLDEAEQKQVVLDFVQKSGEIRQKTIQLSRVFADPNVADPDAASAELQAEIAQLRAESTDLQSLAEPILQDQVSTVLSDLGFGVSNTVFPPVAAHVTPLPAVLIISHRNRIQQIKAVPLTSGILPPERAILEANIYDDMDLSAYVTNIGGLGIYPSMIIETGNINFLTEVIAHEWAHHWFSLRPVGLSYLSEPAMRTINESAASLIGKEVGNEVIRRYYPEFYVPPPEPVEPSENNENDEPVPIPTPDPNVFDFRREMGITRVEVDRLLSAGQIDEAEAYMEERRQIFVAEGYNLRVLNQAYFAFHGAYADVGGGAAGVDPVGPLVADVREASGSLKGFMQNLSSVTSLADLQAVAQELGVE